VRELAQERVGKVLAGHPDARVHGDDSVRTDDDRVEVKLGDLTVSVGLKAEKKDEVKKIEVKPAK
jgi:hypothetical protein